MACQDCFKNCGNSYTSDKCVEYTGPDVPLLGICTGDTLSVVEAQIFEHLIGLLEGEEIVLEDVTLDNCQYLLDMFDGKDKTITNLIQLLVDSDCSLKEQLDFYGTGKSIFRLKMPNRPT